MLAALITVFREVLEACLLVSSLAVALRGIQGRNLCILAGIAAGVLVAVTVAFFIEDLSRWGGGIGQELFNAIISLVAVVMLTWHSVWANQHTRVLVNNMRRMNITSESGRALLYPSAVAIATTVAREGSEIVLFMYGITTHPFSQSMWVVGALSGLLLGVLAGFGMYFGLLKLPVRRIFGMIEIFILFLSCGLVVRAAHQLEQIDLLPSLGERMWDTSFIVSDGSIVGFLLQNLTGYTARPSGLEVVVYITTFIVIGSLMLWSKKRSTTIAAT